MKRLFWAGAFAALFTTSQAMAVTHAEIGDAGQLIGTAQSTPAGVLTQITGSLSSPSGDVDLYRIEITNPAAFSVSVLLPDQSFPDSQIFIFDINGMGILFDDDSGLNGASAFPAGSFPGPAGTYFLGINDCCNLPVSAGGEIFPHLGAVVGPTGPGGGQPLIGYDGNVLTLEFGAYTLNLTGASGAAALATVPEPATASLGLLGLAGLMLRRRRQA